MQAYSVPRFPAPLQSQGARRRGCACAHRAPPSPRRKKRLSRRRRMVCLLESMSRHDGFWIGDARRRRESRRPRTCARRSRRPRCRRRLQLARVRVVRPPGITLQRRCGRPVSRHRHDPRCSQKKPAEGRSGPSAGNTNNRCGKGGVDMRLLGRWGRGDSRRRASAEQPVRSGCSVSFP
jgi:hypothetical protein